MNMDQDWLDQRLAAEPYVVDDGFTARVVSQLPQVSRPAFSLRTRILGCSGVLAFCLFLLQVVPALQEVQQFLSASLTTRFLVHLAGASQQPLVLCGTAAGAALLSFGLLPVLRRWS